MHNQQTIAIMNLTPPNTHRQHHTNNHPTLTTSTTTTIEFYFWERHLNYFLHHHFLNSSGTYPLDTGDSYPKSKYGRSVKFDNLQ
jgi:hypothetical protein